MGYIYGLDISKHNGSLDFNAIKNAGNDFVIIRAGYGVSGTKDPKFEEYYKKAKEVGLKVGAYWYSYALNVDGAKKEAQNFINAIKGKQFEYPVYIDMEDADGYKRKNGMPSNTTLSDICEVFCKAVEDAGYYAGVYASESWFNNQLKSMSKAYDRWVANWGTNDGTLQNKKTSYRMHQFTSEYKLNSKRFDRNVVYDYDYPKVIMDKGLNGFTSGAKPTEPEKPSNSSGSSEYKGNSIVDYLNSIGVDSSYENRKKLANQYGISNYSGTAEQNTKLLNIMRNDSKPSEKPSTSYYKKYTGKSSSIVDALKSIGEDSSYNNRKSIARKNGISNYSGTASQNEKLLSLLKQGKLNKA